MTEDEIALFWAKVDRNGPVVRPELSNCWIWTAGKRNGYGCFSIKRKAQQAHRLSYQMEYDELPALLRHRCDNRECVRPDHLIPGTPKENTRDMLERNPDVTSLSMEQVVLARQLASAGQSIHAIHDQVGGDKRTLVIAIQGKSYQHVSEPPVSLDDIYRPVYYKLSDTEYEEIIDALSRPYHGIGKALAEKYGVHPSLITLIKKGRLKTIRGASHK